MGNIIIESLLSAVDGKFTRKFGIGEYMLEAKTVLITIMLNAAFKFVQEWT